MRLIIENIDAVIIQQLAAGPVQHVSIGFRRLQRFRGIALKEAARDLRQGQGLAMLKRMVVGDHDFRAADFRQHVRWHDLAVLIVIVLLARKQHAQTIEDGDAGDDDQEGT